VIPSAGHLIDIIDKKACVRTLIRLRSKFAGIQRGQIKK